MNKIIAIIGVGYVGLPLAIKFSKFFKVICFDTNNSRISQLKDRIDIFNDQKVPKNKNLIFTNNLKDISKSDYYIITVPTPVNLNNEPDLKHIKEASKIVARSLKKNSIVIYESTVYPGCTEEVCVPILEKYSNFEYNKEFFCAYSPERINVGDNLYQLENIKKIVSASNKKSLNKVFNLYNLIIKAGIHKAENIKVAEAAKVIENTQRDLNIALVNELSIIFEKLKINTQSVLDAAATKWNFVKYTPGLVGGHCVGVDPYYLTYKSKKIGYDPKVILSGRKLNDNMSRYVFEQILEKTKINNIKFKNLKILMLGYSFKENCSDTRNSKVSDLVDNFLKKKIDLIIHDPLVLRDHLKKNHKKFFCENLKMNKKKFNVIILSVPHLKLLKNFKNILKNYSQKKHIIFDIKSALKNRNYLTYTL
jgi:UDP-N-acetyl-D-galactosamine dehydrogenase